MLAPTKPRKLKLADARGMIRDGDFLLWRRYGIISALGRSLYSHVALAAWWDDELMVLEIREWVGGRAVTLRSQVAKYPGRIDHFRVLGQEYDREGAVRRMRGKAGKPYNYVGILCAAAVHTPVVRLFVRPNMRDNGGHSEPWLPEFCSEAVGDAARVGGKVDFVRRLNDAWTEPGDFARSYGLAYNCTLVP